MEKTSNKFITFYKKFGIYVFGGSRYYLLDYCTELFICSKPDQYFTSGIYFRYRCNRRYDGYDRWRYGFVGRRNHGGRRHGYGLLYGKCRAADSGCRDYRHCTWRCIWCHQRRCCHQAAYRANHCNACHDACAAGRGISDHRWLSDHRYAESIF